MGKSNVIACINQKGGTGKSATAENLGIGVVNEGKKVLLIDLDPQGSLTISLGYPQPDEIATTVTDIMNKIVTEKPISESEGILHNPEGVDLLPANIELSGMEVGLVNTISRETVLREYIQSVRKNYDYVFIDCSPSLGMLTINAMAAADSLIIPLQPQYLSAKGLEQLLGTVRRVKRQINPKLRIEGILLTMVDSRTKDAREIADLVREAYGKSIKVFATEIPRSVRMSETSKAGKSIFAYDGKSKAAEAYRNLTREVLDNAEKRRKHQLEELR